MFRFFRVRVPLKFQIVSLIFLLATVGLFQSPSQPLTLTLPELTLNEAREIATNPTPPFDLDSVCAPVLEYEPSRTKAIVLFHGYTNCPAQFSELTPLLTEAGYNVYAPLLPYHGSTDKLTDATDYLTPTLLQNHLEESLGVAATLGEEITTLGISGGGVLAMAALASPTVAHAISLAPSHLPAFVPTWSATLVTKLMQTLPNYNAFWNEEVALNNPGRPQYAYRRFSSHSLAAYQQLTLNLIKNERQTLGRLTVILNPNDKAISNEYAETYPAELTEMNLESDVTYLPSEWNLEHDIIDPNQSFTRPDLVYPFLIDLISTD